MEICINHNWETDELTGRKHCSICNITHSSHYQIDLKNQLQVYDGDGQEFELEGEPVQAEDLP